MIPDAERAVIAAMSPGTQASRRMDLVEELGHFSGRLSREFIESVLVRALRDDPNSIVRHEAAFSLGRLHCLETPLGSTSIDALCAAASHDRSIVARHEAIEVLGSIFEARVRDVLERLLIDSNDDVVDTAYISLERHEHAAS